MALKELIHPRAKTPSDVLAEYAARLVEDISESQADTERANKRIEANTRHIAQLSAELAETQAAIALLSVAA